MNWTEQTEKMMSTWLETQQDLWQSWLTQVQKPVLPSAEAWQQSALAAGEVWQAYLEQWQQFMQPWQQAWQQGVQQFSQMDGMMADWGAFSSAQYEAFQQTFGQWLETPTLGFSREYEEKLRRSASSWQDVQQATIEYQAVIAEAYALAFQRLQEAMLERARSGQPVESMSELTAAWSDVADPAFLEVFYSEKYIRAQGKLSQAIMAYRLQQRELVEIFSKLFDIPTRTEVDAAHKINYEQKKELKALREALAATQAQLADLEDAVAKLDKPGNKRRAPVKKPASGNTTKK